jgi:hypothetical protein
MCWLPSQQLRMNRLHSYGINSCRIKLIKRHNCKVIYRRTARILKTWFWRNSKGVADANYKDIIKKGVNFKEIQRKEVIVSSPSTHINPACSWRKQVSRFRYLPNKKIMRSRVNFLYATNSLIILKFFIKNVSGGFQLLWASSY